MTHADPESNDSSTLVMHLSKQHLSVCTRDTHVPQPRPEWRPVSPWWRHSLWTAVKTTQHLRHSPQPRPEWRPVSPWWRHSRCTAGCGLCLCWAWPATRPAVGGRAAGHSGRERHRCLSTCCKPVQDSRSGYRSPIWTERPVKCAGLPQGDKKDLGCCESSKTRSTKACAWHTNRTPFAGNCWKANASFRHQASSSQHCSRVYPCEHSQSSPILECQEADMGSLMCSMI